MRCLRCGKQEQFSDNLCQDCLIDTLEPFSYPEVVHGTVCPTCFRVQMGRSWLESMEDFSDAALFVARNNIETTIDLKMVDPDIFVESADQSLFRISGRASGYFKGLRLQQEVRMEVRLKKSQCIWCSKQQGNYFEAIIQLRGLDGFSEEEVWDLLGDIKDEIYRANSRDPGAFLTKEEKVRGGYDLYLGSKSFSRALAQKYHEMYGGETKSSSTLYGRKDGNDIYRDTYLIRFPGFRTGDYLLSGKGPLRIGKINPGRINCLELVSKNTLSIDMRHAMKMRVVRRDEVEHDLVVVMETEGEVQVLHPVTMKVVDLVKPDFLLDREGGVGDSVRGALIEDDLFIVPSDG